MKRRSRGFCGRRSHYATLLAAARPYLAGETRAQALSQARRLAGEGHALTIDYLGESARTLSAEEEAVGEFVALAEALRELLSADAGISLDLSHVGLLRNARFSAGVCSRIADILGHDVMISAEGTERTELVLKTFASIDRRNVGVTLQAYLSRTVSDLATIVQSGRKVRLVKGAFDVPTAEVLGRGAVLDETYLGLARTALKSAIAVSFGTHDERLHGPLCALIDEANARDHAEFEFLYGVRYNALNELRSMGYRTRLYVTYGREWFLYLCNRLAEHPSTSFPH